MKKATAMILFMKIRILIFLVSILLLLQACNIEPSSEIIDGEIFNSDYELENHADIQQSEFINFKPEDIFDLVLAEFVLSDGSLISIENNDSLEWLETNFGTAVKADGDIWNMNHAQLFLTRSDGTVGVVYPSTAPEPEGCERFHSSGIDYVWGSGDNEAFLAIILGAIDTDPLTSPLFGNVFVFSGDRRHETLSHLLYGIMDNAMFDSNVLSPYDVADDLLPIIMENDFKIIIEGGRQIVYCMYDTYKLIDGEWADIISGESATSNEEGFIVPTEPGEYIFRIWVDWGYPELYRGTARYHCYFKLII